jgi:hypothetical protein
MTAVPTESPITVPVESVVEDGLTVATAGLLDVNVTFGVAPAGVILHVKGTVLPTATTREGDDVKLIPVGAGAVTVPAVTETVQVALIVVPGYVTVIVAVPVVTAVTVADRWFVAGATVTMPSGFTDQSNKSVLVVPDGTRVAVKVPVLPVVPVVKDNIVGLSVTPVRGT